MDTKPCRSCGTVLSLADFYVHPGMADGHLNVCKVCVRDRVARRQATTAPAVKAAIADLRARTPCARCGAPMSDWHRHGHESRPTQRVSSMVSSQRLEKVLEEVARCEPLCRSCHVREHRRLAVCRRGHDLGDPVNRYEWVDKEGRSHVRCQVCVRGRRRGEYEPGVV